MVKNASLQRTNSNTFFESAMKVRELKQLKRFALPVYGTTTR